MSSSVILRFITLVSLLSCKIAVAETTWQVPVPFASDSFLGTHMTNAAALLASSTNGQVSMTVVHGQNDGNSAGYTEVYQTQTIAQKLRTGDVPGAVVNLNDLDVDAPVLRLFAEPSAAWGVRHTRSFQNLLTPALNAALATRGLKLLYVLPSSFRGLFSKSSIDQSLVFEHMRVLAFDDVMKNVFDQFDANTLVSRGAEFTADFSKESNDAAVASPDIVFSGVSVPYEYFYDLQIYPTFYGLVIRHAAFEGLNRSEQEQIAALSGMLQDDVWKKRKERHMDSLRALSQSGVRIRTISRSWYRSLSEGSATRVEQLWRSLPGSSSLPIEEERLRLERTLEEEYGCREVPVFYGTNRFPGERSDFDRGPRVAEGLSVGVARLLVAAVASGTETSAASCSSPDYANCGFVSGIGECMLDVTKQDQDDFIEGLHQAFMEYPQSVLFVHGFNTSFRQAVEEFVGGFKAVLNNRVMMMFSWPSLEELSHDAYVEDRRVLGESQDTAVDFVQEYVMIAKKPGDLLERIQRRAGRHSVNLVAHSLGSNLALRTMASIIRRDTERVLDHFLLFAPDVSATEFAEWWQELDGKVEDVTVYVASNDDALVASTVVNGYWPLGRLELPMSPKIKNLFDPERTDVVDVKDVNERGDENAYGHTYYRLPIIQEDVTALLEGVPPAKRRNIVLRLVDLEP